MHFGQNNFYDECLHETPTKTAQTGLKTSRTDYVHIEQNQSGVNVTKSVVILILT